MSRLDSNSKAPQTYKAYLRQQAQDALKEIRTQTQPLDTSVAVNSVPQLPVNTQALTQAVQSMQQVGSGENSYGPNQPLGGFQGSILDQQGPITEKYGDIQPGVEVFSHGFTNGLGVGVPTGTKVALPPGKWAILQAFAQDNQKGHIGDSTNSGYGNSVLAQNMQTGEKLRFSHLSQVGVNPGDVLSGGNVIAATGETGNATGPHLNLEYYNPEGKLSDVMQSAYARYLSTSGQTGAKPKGGGNPFSSLLQTLKDDYGLFADRIKPITQNPNLAAAIPGMFANAWGNANRQAYGNNMGTDALNNMIVPGLKNAAKAVSTPFTNKPLIEKAGDVVSGVGSTAMPGAAISMGAVNPAITTGADFVKGRLPTAPELSDSFSQGVEQGGMFAPLGAMANPILSPLTSRLAHTATGAIEKAGINTGVPSALFGAMEPAATLADRGKNAAIMGLQGAAFGAGGQALKEGAGGLVRAYQNIPESQRQAGFISLGADGKPTLDTSVTVDAYKGKGGRRSPVAQAVQGQEPYGPADYYSTDPAYSSIFGDVSNAKVTFKNPLVVSNQNDLDQFTRMAIESDQSLPQWAQANGFDGIMNKLDDTLAKFEPKHTSSNFPQAFATSNPADIFQMAQDNAQGASADEIMKEQVAAQVTQDKLRASGEAENLQNAIKATKTEGGSKLYNIAKVIDELAGGHTFSGNPAFGLLPLLLGGAGLGALQRYQNKAQAQY